MHRDMAAFVNRADCRREGFAACLAFIDTRPRALAAKLGSVSDNAAVWADGTIRPAKRFEMCSGGVFVVKDWICEIDGHRVPLSCYLHSDFSAVRQVHNRLNLRINARN